MRKITEPDDLMLRFGAHVPSLILASSSPNRRSLLEKAGCRVDIFVPEADETRDGRTPVETVSQIARRKMESYLASSSYDSSRIAIVADTLVLIDGELLGKPADEADARAMLHRLSGKEQTVISIAGVKLPGHDVEIIPDTAGVLFRPLSEDDIGSYIATGEWRGAAGAYRLQKTGYTLVERINGDWTTVVGLPLAAILAFIEEKEAVNV